MSNPNHNDWENDPVWNLLDDAKPPQADPFFTRNVMREIRLAEALPPPWWRRLLAPKPLLAGALATAAALALIVRFDPGTPSAPVAAPRSDPAPAMVGDLLEGELLLAASEDPSVFSDEQLVAMLY